MSKHKNRVQMTPIHPRMRDIAAGPNGAVHLEGLDTLYQASKGLTDAEMIAAIEANPLDGSASSAHALIYEDATKTAILPRDPYKADEQSFTTRMGGPSIGELMSEYINAFARDNDGAKILMVYPIPANNSFLFVWEL